jgi:hypothetical protein
VKSAPTHNPSSGLNIVKSATNPYRGEEQRSDGQRRVGAEVQAERGGVDGAPDE